MSSSGAYSPIHLGEGARRQLYSSFSFLVCGLPAVGTVPHASESAVDSETVPQILEACLG